jgi:hypothetical protein
MSQKGILAVFLFLAGLMIQFIRQIDKVSSAKASSTNYLTFCSLGERGGEIA